ncbi:MAG: hypothetical protein OXI82_03005 [Nitrospinae bacterium]|nr:hypothetical protein [Nitrospinota bacterium]
MGRAGICSLIHLAEEEDLSGDEVLQKARDVDFDWKASSIAGYFEAFADSRKKTSAS